MVRSVCPYCAVGCGQTVFIRDGKVVQIEGALDNEENYLIKKLAGEGNDQNS